MLYTNRLHFVLESAFAKTIDSKNIQRVINIKKISNALKNVDVSKVKDNVTVNDSTPKQRAKLFFPKVKLPSVFPEYAIWNGDVERFLLSIPPEPIFDLIVTSPPYNIGKSYEYKKNYITSIFPIPVEQLPQLTN